MDSFACTMKNRMKQIVSYGALWLWRQTSETNTDGREVGEKWSAHLQSSYDFIYSSFEILLKISLKKNYAFKKV